MADLQTWFAPLLWIIGTITAIAGFCRLCRPIWNFIQSPKEIAKSVAETNSTLLAKIDENTERDERNFQRLTSQLNQTAQDIGNLKSEMIDLHAKVDKSDEIQLSLLHDQIIQIYQKAMTEKAISDGDYRRACDLYAQNGGSSYIETLMKEMTLLHTKGVEDEIK